MGVVFVDVGMSLDGFVAGPNGHPGNPMGDGGQRIHAWVFPQAEFQERLELVGRTGGKTGPDNDLLKAVFARIGANVMGRRMFDEGEVAWPENAPFRTPVFVVTHKKRDPWKRPGGTTFYFVTDGFDSALRQARDAAGTKDVRLSGGAHLIRQGLAAGVVEEFTVHLSPVILGAGVRLFEGDAGRAAFEPAQVVQGDGVTHLTYRLKSDHTKGS